MIIPLAPQIPRGRFAVERTLNVRRSIRDDTKDSLNLVHKAFEAPPSPRRQGPAPLWGASKPRIPVENPENRCGLDVESPRKSTRPPFQDVLPPRPRF
jgi:hypothetical protein